MNDEIPLIQPQRMTRADCLPLGKCSKHRVGQRPREIEVGHRVTKCKGAGRHHFAGPLAARGSLVAASLGCGEVTENLLEQFALEATHGPRRQSERSVTVDR